MMAEGYQVRLAKNAGEVLSWSYHHEPLDLVILDLDLPDASEVPLLEKLSDRIPTLPIVVHTFSSEDAIHSEESQPVIFVEKQGNSIEDLKRIVINMLRKTQPHQFRDRPGHDPQSTEP